MVYLFLIMLYLCVALPVAQFHCVQEYKLEKSRGKDFENTVYC